MLHICSGGICDVKINERLFGCGRGFYTWEQIIDESEVY